MHHVGEGLRDGTKSGGGQVPEAAVSAADVELNKGKGGVFVVVDSGPADETVMLAADPVTRMEVLELLELLSGKGGGRLAAVGVAVSLRAAGEAVVPELVASVASEADSVVMLGSPSLEVECEPAPVTRAPVDTATEEVFVNGNGGGLVLVLSTSLVGEADLLVVGMREALVVLDADMGPTVNLVPFGSVEELVAATLVALGVRIDRGKVLGIDKGGVEVARLELVGEFVLSSTDGDGSVSVDASGGVMGGKLVSMVRLVTLPVGKMLGVKEGPDVNITEEPFEKEFLSVKLGLAEVFRASALASVAPGSVEDPSDARLVKVVVETGVGVGLDVPAINVVSVLDVEIVVTLHGPFVCHGFLVL
jgi:hypothetical protein